ARNNFLENELATLNEKYSQEIKELNGKIAFYKEETEGTKQRANHLKDEAEKILWQNEMKVEKLIQQLKEKEAQFLCAQETIRTQKSHAEQALTELKKELEANSARLYDEMTEQ